MLQLPAVSAAITQTARIENLHRFLDFVDEQCRAVGASAESAFAVKLAVEEVCMNLIRHGYAGSEPGPISIDFRGDAERIVVSIRDRGRPFSPDDAPAPDVTSGWEDRPIGGLGWHLVRRMVDRLDYGSDPVDGNCLTITKLGAPEHR